MLTDTKLRKLKYKPDGKNRYKDRDGLYAVVNPGGTVSFRYDFSDPISNKNQIATFGRYFSGEETNRAARLAGLGRMAASITCSTSDEAAAVNHIRTAVSEAIRIFERSKESAPKGPQADGVVPLITLEEARDLHRAFRRQIKNKVNPLQEAKRARELANQSTHLPPDFRSVAERWFLKRGADKSESWKQSNRRYLDAAYPAIGARDLRELQQRDISAVLAPMEKSGGKGWAAEKARQCYSMVFDYAADKPEFLLEAGKNPARALTVDTPDHEHHAHLQASEIPDFFRAIDSAPGSEELKIAVRLLFLTLVRKMELLGAKWTEIDLAAARWLISEDRMKGRVQHIVPLSAQAVHLLGRLKSLCGGSPCVFPHRDRPNEKHMDGNSLLRLYERAGYKGRATPHGTRSTFSSTMNELGYSAEHIEKQLAHNEQDETRASYLHTDFMPARRKLLQEWAEAIDRLCNGEPLIRAPDNVVPIHAAA
jgi:integrase